MPRPPVKKTRRLAEAAELGKLQAQEIMRKKHGKITIDKLQTSIFEHIGKFADKLDADSVLKLGGWIGLTWLVKPILQNSTNMLMEIEKIVLQTPYTAAAWGVAVVQGLLKTLPFEIPFGAEEKYAEIQAEKTSFYQGLTKIQQQLYDNDFFWWVLAAVISALIILFGPSLLESMGGLTKIAGLLLAA